MYFSSKKGFSLLEMLLSIAIISLIGGLSLPIYYSFQARNDLDLATDVITQVVRRAEILSRTMTYDDGWGVYITSGTATLFKGSDYTSRDTSYDEISSIAPSVQISGGAVEITFIKMTGNPISAPITITLNSTSANNISIITINEKGTISF
ncbi:MAG: type II secretion system protein [bacterium]